jgi:hypothetical protein
VSANNYRNCPRCELRNLEALRQRDAEIEQAYGTVSIEEFDRLRSTVPEPLNPTLREDYEFYGHDELLQISYRASCDVCGLTAKISVTRTLWTPGQLR